jgi:hypothetical protein
MAMEISRFFPTCASSIYLLVYTLYFIIYRDYLLSIEIVFRSSSKENLVDMPILNSSANVFFSFILDSKTKNSF